jgi:hypothetical protein
MGRDVGDEAHEMINENTPTPTKPAVKIMWGGHKSAKRPENNKVAAKIIE